MGRRTDIGTYLIITAVALTIWYWAAAETRVEGQLRPISASFSVVDEKVWRVDPPTASIVISAKGSQRAVDRAERVTTLPIEIPAPTTPPHTMTLSVVDLLHDHPLIRETGITITSATPDTLELTVDEVVAMDVRVRPALPRSVQTTGEVTATPSHVRVTMPGRLRASLPDDLTVEAAIDQRELDRLEPGVSHTIDDVSVRLPRSLAADGAVGVEPRDVALTFRIRSQMRTLELPTVRVQLAGPPEDSAYRVAFEPRQLRDVTIEAPVAVVEKIEAGEAVVVAVVHLKSSEKEARIERKPVTCFLALFDEEAIPVDAKVSATGETRPVITVSIEEQTPE